MEIDLATTTDPTPCVIPNQGASVPKPVLPSPELKQRDTKLTNECNGK